MRVPKQLLQRVLGAAFVALLIWQACSMLTLWWYGNMLPRACKPTPQACAGTCVMINLDSLDVMNADMYGISLAATDLEHEHALMSELLYDSNFAGVTHSKLHGSGSSSRKKEAADTTAAAAAAQQQQQADTQQDELDFVPALEQLTQLPAGPTHALHLDASRPLTAWMFSANMRLQLLHLLGDPHAVRLQVGASEGHVDNAGFSLEGFPLTANTNYTLRLRYRSMKADVRQLHFSLIGFHDSTAGDTASSTAKPSPTLAKGQIAYASCALNNVQARSWEVLSCPLTVSTTAQHARLRIAFKGPGSADLDWVSLMPQVAQPKEGAHNSHASKLQGKVHAGNGNSQAGCSSNGSSGSSAVNTDSAVGPPSQWNGAVLDALRALRPRFIRIPVPGLSAESAHQVQEQDEDERKHVGKHSWDSSLTPPLMRAGYLHPLEPLWMSNSVGVYEMMMLCEQLGSAAVLQVDMPRQGEPGGVAGAAAKADAAADKRAGKGKADSQEMLLQLAAAVEAQQKAEDEERSQLLERTLHILEFVMGPPESRWGKVRASMGHPEAWTVRYLALVPEDCVMSNYVSWYNIFKKVLSEKYPDLQLLASHCDSLEAAEQQALWDVHVGGKLQPQQLLSKLPSAVDHHPITSSWQKSPLLSLSSVSSLTNSSNMMAAVAEAAVMAAAERNCRKVRMVSRGPLVHVPSTAAAGMAASHLLAASWDGQVARTPSFYVHQMFAQHRGILCAGTQVLADGVDVKARMSSRHFFADEEYFDDMGWGLQADVQGQSQAVADQQDAAAADDDWLKQAEAFNLGAGAEGAAEGQDVTPSLRTQRGRRRLLVASSSSDAGARHDSVQSVVRNAIPAANIAAGSIVRQLRGQEQRRHLFGEDATVMASDVVAAGVGGRIADGTRSDVSTSAVQLEASAVCTDHQCNRVVVHVVNTGSSPQNVTVYLWSGLRKLFPNIQKQAAAAPDSHMSSTGRRRLAGLIHSGLQPVLKHIAGKPTAALESGQQQHSRQLLKVDNLAFGALGRRGPDDVHPDNMMPASVMATLVQLATQDAVTDTNEAGQPERVSPRMQRIKVKEQTPVYLAPQSVNVLMVDLMGNRLQH